MSQRLGLMHTQKQHHTMILDLLSCFYLDSPRRRLVLIENQVAMVIVDSKHETCSPALEVSDNLI